MVQKKNIQLAKLKESLAQFDKHIQQKEYTKAQNLMARLEKTNRNKAHIQERQNLLTVKIDQAVEKSYQSGLNQYSAENYQRALNYWKRTLTLEPEHEKALEYSQRAERILKRLQQLRVKQKVSPPSQ